MLRRHGSLRLNLRRISFPTSISLSLNHRCNLKCRHCILQGVGPKKELNTARLATLIRQICACRPFSVSITGGEPLLRKDFFELNKLFKNSRIHIILKTNATLISRRIADKLCKLPINIYMVSLDGASPEINDPIRGKGSFKKTKQGILNLIKKNCKVIISCTVTRQNYRDLENIVNFSKNIGAIGVKLNRLFLTGNALLNSVVFKMGYNDIIALRSILDNIKERFSNFAFGSVFNIADNFIYDLHGGQKIKFPIKLKKCPAGISKCAIQPDGWITPCDILYNSKIGDSKKRSIKDIWLSKQMLIPGSEITLKKRDIIDCASCKHIYLCLQYCRCLSVTKNMNKKILNGLYCINSES